MKALFSFEGRVSRKTWWIVTVLSIFIPTCALILGGIVFGATAGLVSFLFGKTPSDTTPLLSWVLVAFFATIFIAMFIVTLTNHAKRFHDRNKSGWWALISFIPWIGLVWVIIECGCLKGDEGQNQYGPDPLTPALVPQPAAISQTPAVEQPVIPAVTTVPVV